MLTNLDCPNAPSGAVALPELGAYLGFLLLITLT